MCAPFSAKAALSFFTRLCELVERSNQAAPRLMPASRPSAASATFSTSGGSGSEVKHHVGLLGDRARRVGPDRAGREVRRGGLLAQIVDHELEAGLLQIARHAGAHGAETDESDLHDPRTFASPSFRADGGMTTAGHASASTRPIQPLRIALPITQSLSSRKGTAAPR